MERDVGQLENNTTKEGKKKKETKECNGDGNVEIDM